MKTLIKLLLFLLISIPLLGQSDNDTTHTLHYTSETVTTYFDDSGLGLWFNDSLWNAIYVPAEDTTITAGGDTTIVIDTFYTRSSAVLPLNFAYDWVYIALYDSGTTYDDSVAIRQGLIRYVNKIKSDTTWHDLVVKDSSWTEVNILVDDNAVHGYLVFTPAMECISINLINAEAVENRVLRFWGSAKKRDK